MNKSGRRKEGGERRQGEKKERGWTNYQEVTLEEDEGRNEKRKEIAGERKKKERRKERRKENGGKRGKWDHEKRGEGKGVRTPLGG